MKKSIALIVFYSVLMVGSVVASYVGYFDVAGIPVYNVPGAVFMISFVMLVLSCLEVYSEIKYPEPVVNRNKASKGK